MEGAQNKVILKPQPGPQERFLATSADICIYGGSAGGGKSYALLLQPLRYKNVMNYGCVVFRKNYNQVFAQGGLWDTSIELYSKIKNAEMRKGDGSWQFRCKDGSLGATVKFAHIERFEDTANWQGSQICSLCCEVNTEILMADGSYKKLKDISVGDVVQTLNGNQKITAIGEEEERECVEVTLENGEKQIHSSDHKILTSEGWVSYEDIILQKQDKNVQRKKSIRCYKKHKFFVALEQKHQERKRHSLKYSYHRLQKSELYAQTHQDKSSSARFLHKFRELLLSLICEPKECHYGSKCAKCSQRNNQVHQMPLCNQYLDQQQAHEDVREMEGYPGLLGFFVCKAKQGLDKGFGLFADLTQAILKHTLFRLFSMRQKQAGELVHRAFEDTPLCGEYAYAQNEKQSEGCRENCLFCNHRYDAHTQKKTNNDQSSVLQLDGVVVRTQKDLPFYAEGKVPKYSNHAIQYAHPYTGRELLSEEFCFDYKTIRITPIGKRIVKNITVDTYNHYITKSGFVNKNCFDELTHFDSKTFFYMLSRNRSVCGVKPYVRATCNPDANSWVADFISWWIDEDTGYPIPERSGKLRYFIRRDETIYWADSKQDLWEQFNLVTQEERSEPRSVTFIASSIYDNKELLRVNPQYLANLKALSTVERERLLFGNWKIKPSAGLYFKASQVGNYLAVIPDDVMCWVRCWDLAASEKTDKGDPAYTAGVLIGKRRNGRYIIADVINRQMSASDVRRTIKLTAQQDSAKYKKLRIRLPQDPGQAGKEQAQSYVKLLSGYDVKTVLESGSKESRANPMAAQWQAGNFDIVIAPWNEPYLKQLENFPDGKFKDMVDASANGFAEVELRSQFNLRNLL